VVVMKFVRRVFTKTFQPANNILIFPITPNYIHCFLQNLKKYLAKWRTNYRVCIFFNCVIFNIQNMFVKMPYNVLQMKYCKLTFITIEKMFHKWNDLNSILKIKCDFITFYKWNGSARCVHKLYITLISQH
jgi:hypothetical protein